MKEILSFFKEIFMITDENSKFKIGLSQFKQEEAVKSSAPEIEKVSKEVKLSDLMRRSA